MARQNHLSITMYKTVFMFLLTVLPSQSVFAAKTTTAKVTKTTKATKTTTNTSNGNPDYCTTAPPSHATFPSQPGDVIPPIPCTGGYLVQQGQCCNGNNAPCTGTDIIWQLPLASCVTVNPQYNGCPGNMLLGVCCSGAGVALEGSGTPSSTVSCEGGAVFTVSVSDGTTITSSYSQSSASDTSNTSNSTTSVTSNTATNTVEGGTKLSSGLLSSITATATSTGYAAPTNAVAFGALAIGAAGAVIAVL
jgi:hypothetical protein